MHSIIRGRLEPVENVRRPIPKLEVLDIVSSTYGAIESRITPIACGGVILDCVRFSTT
jgi:hypothetical protein